MGGAESSSCRGSLILKKLCETRWSSKFDAVPPVRYRYLHIMKVLTRLTLTSEKKKEMNDAKNLKERRIVLNLFCLQSCGKEFCVPWILHQKN